MYKIGRIGLNSTFWDLSCRPFGGSDEEVGGGARRPVPTGCSGLHGNNDPTPGHEGYQCCSSAQWVPSEVLEEGYGHRFGLRGLGHGPPRPSP